ncbi:MAG TPA: glycosyltransferase [Longimicrobiales bacterium]
MTGESLRQDVTGSMALKVAVVTPHFLDGTAQGLAGTRVIRGLSERGHQVTVLVRGGPVQGEDAAPEGPADYHGALVHRVAPDPDRVPAWWEWLRDRAASSRLWDKVFAAASLWRGCRPEEWAWVSAAADRVVELHRGSGGLDVVLTVLNPHIGHLVGLEARRREPGLAWCAYYSDPWPHHLYPDPYVFTVGPVARRRLEGVLERFLAGAGSSVFPSDRLRDHLLRDRRARFRSRAFVAPHLTELRGARSRPPGAALVVRHAGFLMKERRVEPLYDALLVMANRRPDALAVLRVEFAGRYPGGAVPKPPKALEGVVSFLPWMPPDESEAWMSAADVCLLVEAKLEEGIFFPSKLSDYLSVRRPILALSPTRGVVADVLRAGGGLRVEPDDVDAIADALTRTYDAWTAGDLEAWGPTEEQVKAYSAARVIPVYEEAFRMAMEAVR